ncbi:NAD(P)-dependent oxidoreductase [Priestia taiwanensis]|uniref:3-hydroxyisobutyrate dehydrogenase n=1 Tax=Priestia taiwanensis TaxID=1347902 RepID=A0A917ARH6_9BACI|nr:NAD(P)-dependent oxidoreductase [Priestia taiwanensis]MBM7363839.1 3-hydroxyisobutyrate dehydrogenase-like beta-hydroxyacid dehydrogenase [Priestia taiwanensis]GGE69412.1 3-hydroxyisobutyrate dehydrogenase [Priestia taiwanensis]
MTAIGFIGIGVMGKSMAGHLLAAGHDVHVYTRTKEKALDLVGKGAVWEESPAHVAKKATVVMTMVGYPHDVEEVYMGEEGLFAHAIEGTIFIDFTTSTPSLAKTLYEEAKIHSMHTLDAPVSGGDIGARDARLAIMVGGDEEVYEKCVPLLQLLGTNVIYQGAAGAGQHTKMCNQIAIASNMLGVCEALAYAKGAGLDEEKVLQSISTGAAGSWSLSNLAPRMLQDDFDPGFYIKHFVKDMGIARSEAEGMGVSAPGLDLAYKLYELLIEKGEENSGTQALYKYYTNKLEG